MKRLCSNSRVTGCNETISQRGNILCDTCLEVRKSRMKDRQGHDIDELLGKNKLMSNEIAQLQLHIKSLEEKTANNNTEEVNKLKSENERLTQQIKDLEKIRDYNVQLVREKERMVETHNRMRLEIEHLVQIRSQFEMTYAQNKLDKEQLEIELERMVKENEVLKRLGNDK